MEWAALLGRAMMSAIFIWSGIGKVLDPAATIAVFARLGLPLPPVAYSIAVLVELGGGIMLLIGLKARRSALVLAFWCVATAIVVHLQPGDRSQMVHFMKNIGMAGGLLQIAAWGATRLSMDRK
jgi:putative oxidoreductase